MWCGGVAESRSPGILYVIDAVIKFDEGLGRAYAACASGAVSIIQEDDPDYFRKVEDFPVQKLVHSLAVDQATHRVYTPEQQEKGQPATPSGAQIPIGEVASISFARGPSMIRDEDAELTGYVYIDLNTHDYGGFITKADRLLREKLNLPAGFTFKWSGECEFELRAKERLKLILPVVFFVIFLLLYMVFHSVTEAAVLIFPTLYAMTGGLILQWLLGYNFSVAVWVGYIALFGIAVETGVVMVVFLHEALDRHLSSGQALRHEDIEEAVIEGAVQRLRPKLMTVSAVLASLIPILWESEIGSDVMKPIAAPIVGGMITSTIHVLILVPVFFAVMKERALRHGALRRSGRMTAEV